MAQSIYTVKQVNAYIKNMFTQDYMMNRIYVKGEVSNCKYHSTGHIYFSLKDESGTIACVMFAGHRSGLSFRLSDGQQIVVFGAVSVYERSGSYQIYVKQIRLDGEGVLYERFQMLKKELEEMGMFDPCYKKPIPAYAKRIGIVTAPTGAAIRDIINISKRRNPYVQLILYPALVQGAGAKESIVKGIRVLEKADVDVIIVGRGGGSIEDLWAFNEEMVARAVFDCSIPVISAVGHETDWTICDFVADRRVPTPSAAAEIAVADVSQILSEFDSYQRKLELQMRQKLHISRLKLDGYRARLGYLHPGEQLRKKQMQTMEYEDKLSMLMERRLRDSRHRFELYLEKMDGLSPLKKLNQGYAFLTNKEGKTIRKTTDVNTGDSLSVYVTDGVIQAVVEERSGIDYGRK
ncbi:MAG: exodeoxyribonuclease VII large subunit [Dorea sp.]|nr:exodeoxyribonuclease VII large subunit [Dorea sp.]